MRLTNREFVLQFPNHPVSVELLQTGEVTLTGKEKKESSISFKKTRPRKPARKTAVSRAKKGLKQSHESPLEQLFLLHLKAESMTIGLEQEYQFEPSRKWRMDFAWPAQRVAVEIEGGVWNQGRHTRPQGFINDTEKYNHASMNGWTVLRFTEQCVKNGAAINGVKTLFARISGCSVLREETQC